MGPFPIQQSVRMYGWGSWRDTVRELAIGVAIGVAYPVIESASSHELPSLESIVRNITIGVCIIGVARFLETVLSWAIEQSRIPTLFRILVYMGGGWVGYFLAVAITGPQREDFALTSFHFIYGLVATAIAAVIVGLIFHHNRKRNDRLMQAVARLKEHEFAEKELEIARSVQRRLLPPPEIDANGFHISARTDAAHMIGGDFYDVLRLDDGSLAVVVADVSGKGIAASLIMASCKTAVSMLATASADPRDIMGALNAKLCSDLQKREFVAMVYAHCERSRIRIVNAGMPDPLLIRDGSCRAVVCRGERLPLGIRSDRSYDSTTIELTDGERLLMFSDGLPEATVNGEPVGYERVEQLARGSRDLIDALRSINGVTIDDDATAVIISRSPAPQ